MAYKLCKIFRTTSAMDAHVLQALLESGAITAIYVEGNGVPLDGARPLDEPGIRIFIPMDRREEAERLMRERLGAEAPSPYTGSLSARIRGTASPFSIVTDPCGEEQITWGMSEYSPLDESDVGTPVGTPAQERKCPECGAHAELDSFCCDQCGLTLPPL